MNRTPFLPLLLAFSILTSTDAWGWGATAHRIINQNAVIHLPASMAALVAQQSFLAAHASDADNRKSSDTAEAPKHYIDLESYPDYQNLPPSLAVLINQYGWATVKANGILPWATVWALDSLTEQFRRGDWSTAYQTAADLGHYVGDGHQPLHCTVNYDGQLTGNRGIHSRYESTMINTFQASLVVVPDTVRYVEDPYAFALAYILHARAFVDSILLADDAAKVTSGWSGSGTPPSTYYDALWAGTGHFTVMLIQEATVNLASLWYTAWVNAGLTSNLAVAESPALPGGIELNQNFPNPFNPTTVIPYQLSAPSDVRLDIYDLQGRQVEVLVNEKEGPGSYQIRFDAAGLSSGVYLYRLTAGRSLQVRKMLLIR
jgi:hypothetical protein